MPTLTVTIEDTAPVIIYSVNSTGGSDWRAGSSQDDSYADQYSDGTFTLTEANGADASFTFFGTGVQVYGAKRQNHGLFQISIDSHVYPPVSGMDSSVSGTFQFPLFSTVALTPGYHTVRITNLEAKFLDVDFITYQTPIGLDNETLLVTTVQDSESSFTYSPASAWTATPSNLGMFSAGSGHVTTSGGAYADFIFQFTEIDQRMFCLIGQVPSADHIGILLTTLSGDSVALFGPVGLNGAPYSVQLDDKTPNNYSTYNAAYRSQQMLFQASNLGSRQHSVRMQSQAPNGSALTLAIDYAEVFTTPSLQHSSHAGLSTGTIIGISIGGVLGLLLMLYLLYRLRRRNFTTLAHKMGMSGYTGASAMEPPSAFERRLSAQRLLSPPSQASLGHAYSPGIVPTGEDTYNMQTSPWLVDDSSQNIQTITIPFTSDGKYRPDLLTPPILLPPPGGARRIVPVGGNQHGYPSSSPLRQTSRPETNRQESQQSLQQVRQNMSIPPPHYER